MFFGGTDEAALLNSLTMPQLPPGLLPEQNNSRQTTTPQRNTNNRNTPLPNNPFLNDEPAVLPNSGREDDDLPPWNPLD
jgi:hypothetical protein